MQISSLPVRLPRLLKHTDKRGHEWKILSCSHERHAAVEICKLLFAQF